MIHTTCCIVRSEKAESFTFSHDLLLPSSVSFPPWAWPFLLQLPPFFAAGPPALLGSVCFFSCWVPSLCPKPGEKKNSSALQFSSQLLKYSTLGWGDTLGWLIHNSKLNNQVAQLTTAGSWPNPQPCETTEIIFKPDSFYWSPQWRTILVKSDIWA